MKITVLLYLVGNGSLNTYYSNISVSNALYMRSVNNEQYLKVRVFFVTQLYMYLSAIFL